MSTDASRGPERRGYGAAGARAKRAGRLSVRSLGRRVTYPDVLRVLTRTAVRSHCLQTWRALGGDPDHWESNRTYREAMVTALADTEGWLEATHPTWAIDRAAVRSVRRRLESELFP